MKGTFKLKNIIFIVLVLFALQAFAEDQNKIQIEKRGLGTIYKLNGQMIGLSDIAAIVDSNSVARQEMQIAKKRNLIGKAFAIPAGFLIGYPIGTQLGGGEPEWGLAGVGAGMFIIAVMFEKSAHKHTDRAISEYYSFNSRPAIKRQFQLGFDDKSIYFVYNF